MEEVMKMLGPWPVLQFMFGIAVLGGGVWAIIKGTSKTPNALPPPTEDPRLRWEAYEDLKSIEHSARAIAENQRSMLENTRHIADMQRQQTDAIKALMSALWNFKQ